MDTLPTLVSAFEGADQLNALMHRARHAQRIYSGWSQTHMDRCVQRLAAVVYQHAEVLAAMAVKETRMGNVADKTLKNQLKALNIWQHIKDKPSKGIIQRDEANGLVYVAKPMGVVAAVTPITNPVVTPMCNAMFALKAGNAIVLSPHPKSYNTVEYLVNLFNEQLATLGAPEGLIQLLHAHSLSDTQELMHACDVVVATGGMGLVQAAYSSGKPSFGVGAGDVPCILDRDIDMDATARHIIKGASFDNGMLCSSEQCVLVPTELQGDLKEALERNGAFYCTDPFRLELFRRVLFPDGHHMNPKVVGQSANQILAMANIHVEKTYKAIALLANGPGRKDVLCREKLCPVVAVLPYDTFDQALAMAKANLDVEGKGHTAVIHSPHLEHIERVGLTLPVSRIVVNQSSITAGGSHLNGFAPTTTLGCGSWGGNSISENLDYHHLMNVSRIGMPILSAKAPDAHKLGLSAA